MSIDEIKSRLINDGIADVGFSVIPQELHIALPVQGLFNAITLVVRMNDVIIDQIDKKPTYAYYHSYRTVNMFLDLTAFRLCEEIRREGYRSFPIAASQSVHHLEDPYTGLFSHKTGAVLSGLGFIGKSALFIHREHGPRVRLATVLTDMPLPKALPKMECRCKDCMVCTSLCPANAIKGVLPGDDICRDDLIDAEKCSSYMKMANKDVGRGAVCGICVSKCVYSKNIGVPNINKKD